MINFDMRFRDALNYDDVFIVPQYSDITTRAEVEIKNKLGNLFFDVPVLSANMDTISGENMCIAMWQYGGKGALHRFMNIQDNILAYQNVYNKCYRTDADDINDFNYSDCFVSIGVNRDSKERASALYEAKARNFILDIAHGASANAKEMTKWFKQNFKNTHLMVGNVANPDAVKMLEDWGADSIKVGVGPGANCLTKNVTGVTCPQLTAVSLCADVAQVPIIADGGVREIGDVCKAIAVGADFVMLGGMLAATEECPGEVIENPNGKFKIYRGMASRDAMKVIRQENQMPTPEGKISLEPLKGSIKSIIEDIAGGLRSSMSYTGAKTIKEFQQKVLFGTRKNKS